MKAISIDELKKEELHYEYKSAIGGFPKSFWETYSAFANSDGGTIYLGIEETAKRKYKSSGLSKEQIDNLKTILFNGVNNNEKVNVNLISDNDVEEIEIEGNFALKIYVKRCPIELRPVYINRNVYQGTYRRNVDGDYHCSVEEVNAMIRDSSTKPLDLIAVKDQDIDSLDKESIKAYKQMFASLHPSHPFLKKSDELFLEFLGAIRLDEGKYRPTKAGLLMFGLSYRIVYEFPDFFLDYMEMNNNRWENRIQSDSGTWSGNIFSFFFDVLNQLEKNLKTPFKMNGVIRNDDDDIHKAVREALCNTLCNADYNLKGGVTIKQYSDHIEFNNPGCPMMDIEQMIKGGTSYPRNKTLLKMFNLINIGERSGSGIPLIFLAAKENKLRMPNIVEQYNPDSTTLTLYTSLIRKESSLAKLEEDIVKYLENNGPSSAKQISEYLGKNITTIKLNLYSLVDKKIVSTSGTIKDKKYYL